MDPCKAAVVEEEDTQNHDVVSEKTGINSTAESSKDRGPMCSRNVVQHKLLHTQILMMSSCCVTSYTRSTSSDLTPYYSKCTTRN